MKTWKTHLKRAAEQLGSHQALADATGLSRQAITKMLSEKDWGANKISAEMAMRVDTATGGKVSKSELRPDLFEAAA